MKFKVFVAVFVLFLTTCFSAAHANDSGKKIKVGYYEQEVFQEGADSGLIKNGYAYEYYRKLSEYTGFQYEYVYGTFSDLYEELLDGKIDLLAGLAYTKERAEKIHYENLPMGSTLYHLIKKGSDFEITWEPKSINGKKIGVQKSIMVKIVSDWLNENSVEAELVIRDSTKELYSLFDEGKVDLVMIEGYGTLGREDVESVFSVGKTDYYLCVSKQREDVLSEINAFHEKLLDEEPAYLNDLYNKYYPQTVSSRTFSQADLGYLKSLNRLRIGYLNNYLPYCDTDSNGNLTGLLKDMFPMHLKRVGLADRIAINYKAYDTFSDMLADLRNDEIDVAFPVGGGLYFSEENGVFQSSPIIKSLVALVYKGDSRESNAPVFSVNKTNDMQYYYVRSCFPKAKIVFYDSIEECLDAVKKDQVDFTTVNGSRVTAILKNTRFNSLNYRFLRQGDERCYGIKIGNERLLRVVNRGISGVGEQYALNQIYHYTDKLRKYSASDYIRFILYVLIPVVFFTGLITLIHNKRTEKKLWVLNSRLKSALENKERYIADMIRYASSEADADMILNQLVEYIGSNNKPDRVYVFEENEFHSYDNTYEWCNEGITKEKDNLQNVPYEGVLDAWFNEFNKHGNVTIEDVEEYKNVNPVIYDILKPQNIHTLVAIPVKIKGKIIGFIGVDNPPVSRVKAVSEYLLLVEFLFSLMIRMRNGTRDLEMIALHDQLTGFYNRRAYEEAVKECKKQGKKGPFAYVSIDINGLKVVNDTIGHEAGDELISGASECMRKVFSPWGDVYRIGGDEFIVMAKVEKDQIEDMNRAFQKTCEEWKGELVEGLSVSCGYVCTEENPDLSFHEIILLADKRMYEAKSAYYRKSGIDRRGQQDAHKSLCMLYTKILKINLTDDTYHIINMDISEQTVEMGFNEKLSKWFKEFSMSGLVHPEDLEEYLRLTDMDYLRSYFSGNKTSLHIFYRRKYGDDFKQVMMEIIHASDYSDENQSLYLYVKDIDK